MGDGGRPELGPARERLPLTSPISTGRSTSSTRLSPSTTTTSSECTQSAPVFTLVADTTPDGPQAQVKRYAGHHSVGHRGVIGAHLKHYLGIYRTAPRFHTWLPPSRQRSRLATVYHLVVTHETCSELRRKRFANVVCTELFCFC